MIMMKLGNRIETMEVDKVKLILDVEVREDFQVKEVKRRKLK